jgi:hypothetical protein
MLQVQVTLSGITLLELPRQWKHFRPNFRPWSLSHQHHPLIWHLLLQIQMVSFLPPITTVPCRSSFATDLHERIITALTDEFQDNLDRDIVGIE